jgi:3D (Asp-Asp-Asp) domain-containing protein
MGAAARNIIALVLILILSHSRVYELKYIYITRVDNLRMQAIINELARVTVSATAYNAVSSQTDDTPDITSCNFEPTIGSIAVSQDLYFKGWTCGKRVHLQGLGIFIIKDVMHFRKTNQIDIVMKTEAQAIDFGYIFGRKAVLLTSYEEGR